MSANAGQLLNQKLHDFHLADVGKIVQEVMREHEAGGCKYADGAYERTMTRTLIAMRSYLAAKLEAEENECPHREAAALSSEGFVRKLRSEWRD
jgi:hypothetical protein